MFNLIGSMVIGLFVGQILFYGMYKLNVRQRKYAYVVGQCLGIAYMGMALGINWERLLGLWLAGIGFVAWFIHCVITREVPE